ncbi:MAG TPA: hypothetical protein PLP17_03775, partial [Oligoflexia bacterium]|nr:hypothetical protein [Oligoflexia bacterium]
MPSRTCALFASRRIQNNRAFLRDSPGSFDANARADEPACGERGSTMVEFAVTFLPFLLLILGLIQLLIIGFTAVGIQY